MKQFLILLLTLPLMGCYADQQQQLGRCIFDAENIHPDSTWLSDDARQNYTWLCMAANGFRLNRLQNTCEGSASSKRDVVLFASATSQSVDRPI